MAPSRLHVINIIIKLTGLQCGYLQKTSVPEHQQKKSQIMQSLTEKPMPLVINSTTHFLRYVQLQKEANRQPSA